MTKTNFYTPAARAVPAAAQRWLARRAEARREAATLRALHDMPDHLLRDIGLVRGRF
jgi:uncharacterized protein YjiS (DUF1127 family)